MVVCADYRRFPTVLPALDSWGLRNPAIVLSVCLLTLWAVRNSAMSVFTVDSIVG